MHEICMQSPRPERYPVEQRMSFENIEGVPTHMWNLQLGIRRRNAIDFAWHPPQAWRHPILASAFRHQLHAGAFADCRRGLDAIPGMVDALERSVRKKGATTSGSPVTAIGCSCPLSRAARSKAFAAECRLPEP